MAAEDMLLRKAGEARKEVRETVYPRGRGTRNLEGPIG